MPTDKPPLRYEDAAELRQHTIWTCVRCNRLYPDWEDGARCCCATDRPCAGGCGGRYVGPRTSTPLCDGCRQKRDDERWAKLPEVEWDGETALCGWDGDRFFFDPDEVREYVADHDGLTLEDMRLVLCEKAEPPTFDAADHFSDETPEDWDLDPGACERLDAFVDAWAKENLPDLWHPTGKRVSLQSLREWGCKPEKE
ncbi:MAG: hypothetical protein E6Q97_14450 [Desulfurellales bacterium]|nr:MAG: hypothetical protein E6Q97_14450 [Desulfurellales bacterium]